jgi:hypothetical protein
MSTFDMPYFYNRVPSGTVDTSTKIKKIRPRLPYESRRDFQIIMGLSAILLGVFLITVLIGPIMSSWYGYVGKSTECRSKILSYEQHGYYTSQEEFRSAIAYC